jgi:hypothetical protein
VVPLILYFTAYFWLFSWSRMARPAGLLAGFARSFLAALGTAG